MTALEAPDMILDSSPVRLYTVGSKAYELGCLICHYAGGIGGELKARQFGRVHMEEHMREGIEQFKHVYLIERGDHDDWPQYVEVWTAIPREKMTGVATNGRVLGLREGREWLFLRQSHLLLPEVMTPLTRG